MVHIMKTIMEKENYTVHKGSSKVRFDQMCMK